MKDSFLKKAEEVKAELTSLVVDMYHEPEIANVEFKACRWHIDLLRKHGFEVEERFSGVETGYKAVYDSKKPGKTVAYMAEYDALPGIGHGCGHNILGATSLGAAIVLKDHLDHVGGKVVVFGTPAEETSGAKVTYAKNGEFEGLDFAMMAHPAHAYMKSGTSLALEPIEFEFFGKPSHAASEPEKGINALDAGLITMTAINALREHIRPDSRVHGIVVKGGEAANVVPEYTKLQYYVRSTTKTYNQELLEKVKNCARAGALATGCELKITQFEFAYDNLITNRVLSDVFDQAILEVGNIVMDGPKKSTGSLDMGQVSQYCPTIHPYFDITNDRTVAGHTRELADATITPYALDNMVITASALALTAYRVMSDESIYESMKEEFLKAEK
ncbi:MAG: M20 family metallopeptidase [Peptostreptococcaceae bacterium]|nr:M20 family metallopeptidase [Peptostreptococcaceae bacterium]